MIKRLAEEGLVAVWMAVEPGNKLFNHLGNPESTTLSLPGPGEYPIPRIIENSGEIGWPHRSFRTADAN